MRPLLFIVLALSAVGCQKGTDTSTTGSGAPVTGDPGYDKADKSRDSPCELGGYGACIAEADCSPDKGHLSSASCSNQEGKVCCAPLDKCDGQENFVCCDSAGVEHRPTCDSDKLACPYGQKQGAKGSCKPADAG